MTDDLVAVVRCRDCDIPYNRWTGCPKLLGRIPNDDFYCADGIRKKNNEIFWKLTDVYEMGYEYECPVCGRHIDVRRKDKDLPEKCPYCETKMDNI